MPKYDYRCGAGHQYEKRESFDAPAVQECQECGAQARRVLTPPAIVFKGSGWYITDSRKNGSVSTDSAGTAATSDSTSSTSAEAKTETKTKSDAGNTPSTAAAD